MSDAGSVRARLKALGIDLPVAAAALGSYVPAVRSGDSVLTSGQLPMAEGILIASGLVGQDVTVEVASECARQAVVNALAAAATVCDLDEIVQVVKVTGYVASAPGFTEQPAVVNGASDLLVAVFGDAGKHAREAVGVASLPLNAPVELSVLFGLA